MKVWGLTGGIASGKSLVSGIFKARGIPIVDADQVSRDLSSPGGAAHGEIVARFGTADRLRLREIIFNDEQARRDLEAILHPKIIEESRRRFEEFRKKGHPLVIYEASLLVETGRHKELDGLLVVTSPEALRIQRLMKRDGISELQARQIIAAQSTDEMKLEHADEVIMNDGTEADLEAKVSEFLKRFS